MATRPEIPLLRPDSLGSYSFEDYCTRHKLYFDLVPYIIGIHKGTAAYNEALGASINDCLLHFRPSTFSEKDTEDNNSRQYFYRHMRNGKSANINDEDISLIYEIYGEYNFNPTKLREIDPSNLTMEKLEELASYCLEHIETTPIKEQLFPHDEKERDSFLAFCEITRDIFYLKTLDDKEIDPWTSAHCERRWAFDRRRIKITKKFVLEVASSMASHDKRWSPVLDSSGAFNFEKMDHIIKKYSSIAPILYALHKIGWPSNIWANKLYCQFDKFVENYREIYGILTSKHVFAHHNENYFTESRIYWLDLRSWPSKKPSQPQIKKALISAVSPKQTPS